MTIATKASWEFHDAENEKGSMVKVGPGTFEVQRVRHPFGLDCYWLVLTIDGHRYGAAEGYLRSWPETNPPSEFTITIEE